MAKPKRSKKERAKKAALHGAAFGGGFVAGRILKRVAEPPGVRPKYPRPRKYRGIPKSRRVK
jgi:hypothetical protein